MTQATTQQTTAPTLTQDAIAQAIAVDALRISEGYRQYLYKDTLGNDTIGYGLCISTGLYPEEAEFILRNRVKRIDDTAIPLHWYNGLSTNRKAIILCMFYQLGIIGVLHFSKMIQAIEANDWQAVGGEMMHSKWAAQAPDRAKHMAYCMVNDEPLTSN